MGLLDRRRDVALVLGQDRGSLGRCRALHDAVDPEREPFVATQSAAGAISQACYADRDAADRYLDRLQQVAAALHNPAVDIMLHWASALVERADHRFDAALHHL